MTPQQHSNARLGVRLLTRSGELFLRRADQDAQDFFFAHDDEIFAIDLDLGASVLAEQDAVAFFHSQREHFAFVVRLALADGDDFAFLGFVLGRVGDDDATAGGISFLNATDEDTVVERGELGSQRILTPFVALVR